MTPSSTDLSKHLLTLSIAGACVLVLGCSEDPGSTQTDTGTTGTETGETGEPLDCSDRPIEVPAARGEIEGVWDAERGRMLVFAGDKGTPIQCMSQTDFVAEVWAFHPDCDNFERLDVAAGMSARGRYALAHDPSSERVFIHGGRWRADTSGTYTVWGDLWAYELATDSWTALPAGATPRSNHVAAVIGDRLIIHGGNTSDDGLAFAPLGDTWAFDLGTETWAQVATTNDPSPRLFHAAAASPEGTLFIYGGGDQNAFTGPFFTDLWALDVESGVWTLLDAGGSGPAGPTWSDLLFDADANRLILWAGHEDNDLGNTNALWTFDLGGGGWTKVEVGDVPNVPAAGFCDFPADFVVPDLEAPERRSGGAAVLTDAGEMLIFGGKTDCGLINDAWSWSLAESVWTERSPATVGEICLRAFAECQAMCF